MPKLQNIGILFIIFVLEFHWFPDINCLSLLIKELYLNGHLKKISFIKIIITAKALYSISIV